MITNRKKSQKGDITQSIMYEIYSKLIQINFTLDTNCGYPDILFAMSLMAEMPKSEKVHYSVKYSQKFKKD